MRANVPNPEKKMQKRRIKTHPDHRKQLRNYETGMAYAGLKSSNDVVRSLILGQNVLLALLHFF